MVNLLILGVSAMLFGAPLSDAGVVRGVVSGPGISEAVADSYWAVRETRRLGVVQPPPSLCDQAIIDTTAAVGPGGNCSPTSDGTCPESCTGIFRSALATCAKNNTVTLLGPPVDVQPAILVASLLSEDRGACNAALVAAVLGDEYVAHYRPSCSDAVVLVFLGDEPLCGSFSADPPCPDICQVVINASFANCRENERVTIQSSFIPPMFSTGTASEFVAQTRAVLSPLACAPVLDAGRFKGY